MPMPVSTTASSIQSRPLATRRACSLTSPSLVNLQALLNRLSSICRSRMGSTVNAPRFSWASTMRRFLFCSASCPAVPMTSLISGPSCTVCGLSSSFPASIFDRSSTWLMRPRRCVPARFTRCSGSCAFSVPKRAAFLTIISVSPMMALSGGAQLMAHARDELRLVFACQLQLAALVLDFIEQPYVLDRDDCLVGEGLNQLDLLVGEGLDSSALKNDHADRRSFPYQRNAENGADTAETCPLQESEFGIGLDIRDMNDAAIDKDPPGRVAAVNCERTILHECYHLG